MAVTGRIEAKKLLSHQRQSNFSSIFTKSGARGNGGWSLNTSWNKEMHKEIGCIWLSIKHLSPYATLQTLLRTHCNLFPRHFHFKTSYESPVSRCICGPIFPNDIFNFAWRTYTLVLSFSKLIVQCFANAQCLLCKFHIGPVSFW